MGRGGWERLLLLAPGHSQAALAGGLYITVGTHLARAGGSTNWSLGDGSAVEAGAKVRAWEGRNLS